LLRDGGEEKLSQHKDLESVKLIRPRRVVTMPDRIIEHGFAYIAIDSQRRFDENQRYMFGALEDQVDPAEMEEHLKTLGVFMLISSEDVPAEDILPLYYTRQVIEQIFDLDKNNVDLLPLRTHSEETFRGHLMLTFLAAVAFLVIREKLNATKWNVTGAFAGMAPLKCKVYKNELLIKEPTKKMKNISDSLKLKIPEKMNVQNADILRFK
jgi:transposase